MPGLLTTGHFSSGQDCQVRSGWSEQDRSRGSGDFRTILVRSVNQVSSVWLVQVRSGLLGQVRSGYVRSVQVRSGHVSSG